MATFLERDVTPPNIKCETEVTDVMFHPTKPVIIPGLINGKVFLYAFDTEGEERKTHEMRSIENHKKSVRCVRLDESGTHLYTASKDRSWSHVDLETGQTLSRTPKAHEDKIYSQEVVGEHMMLTGDESGVIKMWDMRRLPRPVMELKDEFDDFISDMVCHTDKKTLLVTCGDGTLTCINLKKKAVELQSELHETDFLSIAIMKDDTKVVVGDGEGVLNIFNWDEWGALSDRYPCHPDSIDCMLPLSDDVLCTGCMDGKIRLMTVLPYSVEQEIGSHEDLPVQRLTISHDGALLASCCHDEYVRFWEKPELDALNVQTSRKAKPNKRVNHDLIKKRREEFFSDM